jgi:hypothetical protein
VAKKDPAIPTDQRAARWLRNALLVVAGLVGLVWLIRLACVRNYDYDEISHAHMAWLVSVGEKPYQDFAANHFPFFWIVMAPVMHLLPQGPVALVLLRGLAALLNAVFIGALGTLICLELRPWQRIWAVACFGVMVFSPTAVQFLIEFRPDALANALLFSALLWVRLRGTGRLADGLLAGLVMGAAVLVNTKYILLPFVMGAVLLALHFRRFREFRGFALALAGGFAGALLGGLLVLLAMRISVADAWRLVVTYNGAVEKAQSFGFGLASSVARSPLCLLYVVPGLVACVVMFVRNRRLPKAFEIAIFVFLVLNLCLTTRPWKQYTASWLLLAAGLPARSLPLLATRFSLRAQAAMAGGFLAIMVFFCAVTSRAGSPNWNRTEQDRAMTYALQHVPPDGYVLASYFAHPIFRRDSLFKTVYDAEVAGTDGLEQFMPQLAPGAYGEQFGESGYKEELEVHRPSLILMQAGYTLSEIRAMTAFMKGHPDAYGEFQIPGTRLTVLENDAATRSSEPGR